jgi:DNA primase small subunit
LIFDIDADSIPTSCKKQHNYWYCENCDSRGRFPTPKACPSCHGSNLSEIKWVCDECLDATKSHCNRLLDFLTGDFGASPKSARVYFSGNRGYHIHVDDERFEPLDSQARGEIAGYIMGSGLVFPKLTVSSAAYATANDGWLNRITESFAKISATTEGNSRVAIKRGTITQRFGKQIVEENAAMIDPSVTTDIHRVFRMPGTLHGNTGMEKMRVKSLESFDPFVDPVVLGNEEVEVMVRSSPVFILKGQRFGPFNSIKTHMPTFAAVYLVGRGLAEVQ